MSACADIFPPDFCKILTVPEGGRAAQHKKLQHLPQNRIYSASLERRQDLLVNQQTTLDCSLYFFKIMASETNLPPQRHSLKRILAQLQALMPELRAKYRVQQLELFGSYLRGDATLDSDVDILVTFQSPPTLLEFIELENYLGDVLQLKVDLVMKTALKPAIGERILSEAQPV